MAAASSSRGVSAEIARTDVAVERGAVVRARGPGSTEHGSEARVEPYTIAISQHVLDDVRSRLGRTSWPDEVGNDRWERGTRLAYLRELVSYWLESFDWQATQSALNELPHFRTEIGGLGIHFVHMRGRGPTPLPLVVVTHGWPSTVFELSKLLPRLADPGAYGGDPADAFDVVAPSLPGFGFSDVPTEPLVHRRVPELWVELTCLLGYERFGAHGGDLGGGVTARLGMYQSEHVIGIHVTNVYGTIGDDGAATDAERRYLTEVAAWEAEEGAYAAIQGTRPQTLSVGLNDSPAGLAAWIVEKLRAWSDCDGDIERVFSKDEILTTVTLLLGDADRRRVVPTLLRPPARPGTPPMDTDRRAVRRGGVPARPRTTAEGVRRTLVQRAALDRDAARRSLRGVRATGSPGRGYPQLLPQPSPRSGAMTHSMTVAVSWSVQYRREPTPGERGEPGRGHHPRGQTMPGSPSRTRW